MTLILSDPLSWGVKSALEKFDHTKYYYLYGEGAVRLSEAFQFAEAFQLAAPTITP